jgi:hypothetical protein
VEVVRTDPTPPAVLVADGEPAVLHPSGMHEVARVGEQHTQKQALGLLGGAPILLGQPTALTPTLAQAPFANLEDGRGCENGRARHHDLERGTTAAATRGVLIAAGACASIST